MTVYSNKKLLFLLVAALVFWMAGYASATPFSFDSGLISSGQSVQSNTNYEFTISTSGFSVPSDTVTSATLTINAKGVHGSADTVYVGSPTVIDLGTLNTQQGSQHLSSTTFNLVSMNVFSSFPDKDALSIYITAGNQGFTLESYELTVNGTVGGDPPAVPESATLLLFGSGLIGLVVYRRKYSEN